MNSSVSEIRAICVKQETHDSNVIKMTRKITPYLTWLLLKAGLSANQTTLLGMGVGSAGALLLCYAHPVALCGALVLLHLSNLLDYCDGEIARYHGHFAAVRRYDISGAYLDWLWHFYIPTATIFCLALGVYRSTGALWLLPAGFIALLGFCIFPFTCKEHILVDQLRKHPDLLENPGFLHAMQDHPGESHAPGEGGEPTLPARVKKQVAEWTYYPSFFNVLTVVVLADVASGGFTARSVYLVVLCLIISTHQVKKIRDTFMLLKNIRYER